MNRPLLIPSRTYVPRRPRRGVGGRFVFFPGEAGEFFLPNELTNEGEQEFLKMICRDDQTIIAAGANFYIGLTEITPSDTLVLADVEAVEPDAGTNNYQRAAIPRDAVGWPTMVEVNGENSIRSAVVTFTASGGAFSRTFTRAFLTAASSGTVGKLFSISSPLTSPILLSDGQSFPMAYELFLY